MGVILTVIIATLVTSASAFAGEMPIVVTTPVPTLSEWGMITMVGALGVIGAIALRKRLASKVG